MALNAIQTFMPLAGQLVCDATTVEIIIYGFYFRGTELCMVVINLTNMQVYNAQCLEVDVMHSLGRSCTRHGFKNFTCKLAHAEIALTKLIQSAVVRGNNAKPLQKWLDRLDVVVAHPKSYKPLTVQIATEISNSRPTMTGISSLANNVLVTEFFRGVIDDLRAVMHMREVAEANRRLVVKQEEQEEKEQKGQLPIETHPKAKRRVRAKVEKVEKVEDAVLPSIPNDQDVAGFCIYDNCPNPAICFWTTCCKDFEPICCPAHAFQKKCPRHNKPSRIAQLIPTSAQKHARLQFNKKSLVK